MTIRHTKAEGPSANRLTDKCSFQLPKARKESQAAGDATAGCGAGRGRRRRLEPGEDASGEPVGSSA